MMPKAKVVMTVSLCILGSVALALVITFFLHRPSMKVVAQWKQPTGIPYDERGPYYMSVVEGDLNWDGFPLYVGRNYEIYVSWDESTPTYGHWIKYSFHPHHEEIEQFLSKADVQWTAEGVTLSLP